MEERYIASMVLCGTGDAMGYYRGRIEFCTDIKKIQKMVDKLSSGKGVMALNISGPDWIVSDGKKKRQTSICSPTPSLFFVTRLFHNSLSFDLPSPKTLL